MITPNSTHIKFKFIFTIGKMQEVGTNGETVVSPD